MSIRIDENKSLKPFGTFVEGKYNQSFDTLCLHTNSNFYSDYVKFFVTQQQLTVLNSKKTLSEQIKVFSLIIKANDFSCQEEKFNIFYDVNEHLGMPEDENRPFTFLRND